MMSSPLGNSEILANDEAIFSDMKERTQSSKKHLKAPEEIRVSTLGSLLVAQQ